MLKKDGAGGISTLGSVIAKMRESARARKRLWLVIGGAVVVVAALVIAVVVF